MRKIYSLVLMAAMLLLGTNAWAQNVAKIGETEYATLNAAITAVTNGQTIEVLTDISNFGGVAISGEKIFTIDLAGHTISGEIANGNAAPNNRMFVIKNGAQVTIKNGILDAKGECVKQSGTSDAGRGFYGAIRTENSNYQGSATTSVFLTNLVLKNYRPWGLNIKICEDTYAEVDNCTVISEWGGGIEVAGGIAVSRNSSYTQTKSHPTTSWCSSCLNVSTSGVFDIYNSMMQADGERCLYVYSSGGTLNVHSGVYKSSLSKVFSFTYDGRDNSIINVEGGDFTGGTEFPTDEAQKAHCELNIKGGRFTFDPTDYIPENLENPVTILNNNDGTWSVVPTASQETSFDNVTEESVVVVPASEDITIEPAPQEETVNVAVEQVNIPNTSSVTISDGATLNVGESGIILADAAGDNVASLVVEAGGTLMVNGLIQNSENAEIIVEASEGSNGYLLISPNTQLYGEDHPKAYVKLTSKGYKRGENDYVWQRFGVPAWASTVKRSDVTRDDPAALTAMYYWNYGTAEWISMPNADTFVPFQCYQMTTTINTPGTVYTFPGELIGNGNATLEFRPGFNFYANSYTAPIDLTQLVSDLSESHPTQISGAIYVYRETDDWWDVISFGDIDDYRNGIKADLPQISIEPMQAFVLQLREGTSDEAQINYETNIWDFVARGKVIAPVLAPAPARLNANSNSSYVMITVKDNNSDHSEEIVLRENNNFSEGFDNGYDVEKMMNDKAFNFFAATETGNMVQLATDDLVGQLFSMTTKNETSFTMTFSNTRGTEYAMKDMMTNTIIPMTDGASYTFTTLNNATIDGRFQIVSINHVVTNMETVNESSSKASGIYSIMGQYLGEATEWNNLPAGVYVVDGVKVIK